MFIPNNRCTMRSVSSRSMYGGMPTYGASQIVECAIVRLRPHVQKTSVRADSSATKGSSDEIAADAVILFPASINPKPEALIEIAGYRLRVTGSQPRFNLLGDLDHHEVTLDQAGEIH